MKRPAFTADAALEAARLSCDEIGLVASSISVKPVNQHEVRVLIDIIDGPEVDRLLLPLEGRYLNKTGRFPRAWKYGPHLDDPSKRAFISLEPIRVDPA